MARSWSIVCRRVALALAAGSVVATAAHAPAQAQVWPTKRVQVVVPFSPGSATDLFPRTVFEHELKLSKRGEYEPILRMVRLITTIDPHQIDVYATGAWHMAYNFMDKRLIEDGVRFLEEGCRNNRNVYDLFFELGYMHYDKSKNYPEAAHWYYEGRSKPTTWGKIKGQYRN